MNNLTKLSGWKMIARHLGRSERTIQLWEAERRLPVRRIPGTKGWTVYAYVQEIDAWMAGTGPSPIAGQADRMHPSNDASDSVHPATSGASPADHLAPPLHGIRKPGLLVLPFQWRARTPDAWYAEVYAEELIARFAALHPSLRVLSSTTSQHHRDRAVSAESLAREFGVRYLVEGSIVSNTGSKRVDIRVVDAELDQVLLTNRFASSRVDDDSFRNLVIHGVVEHLSLVLSGALVEPLYPNEIDPECHVHYLEGVDFFTTGTSAALRDACKALDRALIADAAFTPARAMRALAHLQIAAIGECPSTDALRAARTISDVCKFNPSARVTAAFLDAAIAIEFDDDVVGSDIKLSKALLAMPPSVGLRGRLYERRSHRPPSDAEHSMRRADRVATSDRTPEGDFTALDELVRDQPQNLFAGVLRAMAGVHRRRYC